MGKIKEHLPVKLFAAITCSASFNLPALYDKLEKFFSPIEQTSASFNFSSYTDYYQSEMGDNLQKLFIAFSDLIDPAELPVIKVTTNLIESEYMHDNIRPVNIDPGYIESAKLVLATTKNYSHRIYLNQGIFADLHLHFAKRTFQPQPWTYPDYIRKDTIVFFNAIRKRYLEQLVPA
jgi:hypothetical protein